MRLRNLLVLMISLSVMNPSEIYQNHGYVIGQCSGWVTHQFNQGVRCRLRLPFAANGDDVFRRRIFEQSVCGQEQRLSGGSWLCEFHGPGAPGADEWFS